MPWLLSLHICALLGWCGTLLYLPALVADAAAPNREPSYVQHPRFIRHVFTLLATPAALIAIGSGTALFFAGHIIELWLMAKLTLVIGLVACHVLIGWVVLRNEQSPGKALTGYCVGLGSVTAALVVAILWLVLAKPLADA